MKYLLILIISLMATSVQAFNDYYDCIQVGGSSIGWSGIHNKYEAESSTKSEKPISVKLTDLNTETPYLSGQSTTKLAKASSNESTLWLLQFTTGGTVVTWTLFDKSIELGSPKTLLISSKSYDMMVAVNFSTIYECKP